MKKKKILEYFNGNPDTISEFDNETRKNLDNWYFDSSDGISFGWFQTSISGSKEFVAEENTSHHALTQKLAEKVVGKAIASEYIGEEEVESVGYAINMYSSYKGRTFTNPKIITTWYKVSSDKLYEILELLGGVENFMDYSYVCDGMPNEINVIDYINMHIKDGNKLDAENMSNNIQDSSTLPEWLIRTIIEYNTPNSTLAAKTSKLGNMTIAQYNSLIHQESKKSNKVIKEKTNNMKNNKHQEEFSNYIEIMNEALKKNDYKAYEYAKNMLDESVEECKHESELMNEMNTNNFGVLNHIFENELPMLIKSNKKAVKEVIKTIKEDKNLRSQFNFYNVIKEQYNSKHAEMITPDAVLEKIAKVVCEGIDLKTVKASNDKLRKVMVENNIIPSDFIDDESKNLYENGNVILTTKRTTNNMIPIMESYDVVCKWMDKHKNDKKSDGVDVDTLIEEFENKLKTNLNESEMSFVQEITDFRSPIAESRKEKLFNKFKNECISKINEMLKEDAENTELKGLSNQINEMQFNKETIVKDIAKLLEIRDILMDD